MYTLVPIKWDSQTDLHLVLGITTNRNFNIQHEEDWGTQWNSYTEKDSFDQFPSIASAIY